MQTSKAYLGVERGIQSSSLPFWFGLGGEIDHLSFCGGGCSGARSWELGVGDGTGMEYGRL